MNTILVAEDEPEVREYLGVALRCQGYRVEFAHDGEEAVNRLRRDTSPISLLLLDLIMPRKDGFATLREVRTCWPSLPVITLSGACSPANIVLALKHGAQDFLPKPPDHADLFRSIEKALLPAPGELTHLAHEEALSRLEPSHLTWTERLELLLERVSSADVPVLLRGETGVGKEVLARQLHEHSRRAGKPFLKLNCAALPSELVESELFGYEKGAFTGALKSTPGRFEQADTGTILLDEIGDMDFKLQAKLLQVLQDREFLRLGAKDVCCVDVRVMAATHCNLEQAIADGRFREDLYYRLNIVEIHIPALRERREEIVPLARLFLHKHGGAAKEVVLEPALESLLLDHDWPGNVRELENVMRKYLVYGSVPLLQNELRRKRNPSVAAVARQATTRPGSSAGDVTQVLVSGVPNRPAQSVAQPVVTQSERALPAPHTERAPAVEDSVPAAWADDHSAAAPAGDVAHGSVLARVDHARREAETKAILATLQATMWNRKQAARELNIDYKALLYKMKKLGIGERNPSLEPASAGSSRRLAFDVQ